MRRDDGYFEDLDNFEEFNYGRSRALQKLLDSYRREERHQLHHRNSHKKRYQRAPWDWDDDDVQDSCADDSRAGFYREPHGHY